MVRLPGKCEGRAASGWGVDFAGSPLIFPGRDGAPFSNQAFNARIKLGCARKVGNCAEKRFLSTSYGEARSNARLSRLRRLLGAFPAQRLTGNAETVGRPGRKVIGDGLAKRQKSDLLKVSFHSPAVQQSRVESVLKLEAGVRLWARPVTRWQPANRLHLLP
jgi:hypothetical protein